MSFDSLLYLLFLPCLVTVYTLCPKRARWIVLLAGSILFYASWDAQMTLLLLSVILIAYLSGRGLHPGIAVALCLALLCYFKYFSFLLGICRAVLSGVAFLAGTEGTIPPVTGMDIVLPVGLSFYIFQAIGYILDVARKKYPAEKHLGFFALFICFFPQLVAGPIERADSLLPQLRECPSATREDLRCGFRLLLTGYFRKFVIANACGRLVTAVYSLDQADGSAVCLATLLFALQIYCDFAGYSEIAGGSARLFGIRLMRNFDSPYLAGSLKEFWRRWHISLYNWLQNYIYIPLGGSRKGKKRQILAILLVFLVSGLWHGAGYTFLIWGLLHGVAMAAESAFPGIFAHIPHKLRRVLTFLWVCVLWIFFRASSIGQAVTFILSLLTPWHLQVGLSQLGLTVTDALWLFLALCQLPYLAMLGREAYEGETARKLPLCRYGFYMYLLFCIMLAWLIGLSGNGANAFIYFQF